MEKPLSERLKVAATDAFDPLPPPLLRKVELMFSCVFISLRRGWTISKIHMSLFHYFSEHGRSADRMQHRGIPAGLL